MRRLTTFTLAASALVLVAACETSSSGGSLGDSTARSAGFSDYAQYMRAQEELSRARGFERSQTANQPASIAQEAVAAVRGDSLLGQTAQADQATGAPLSATGGANQIDAAGTPQDEVGRDGFTPRPFGSAQPEQLVQRDFVPEVRVTDGDMSEGAAGPNLFAYALSTTHGVGDERFSRTNPLRWRRSDAACRRFSSPDLAQEAFLAAGGPERDPNHLDPDGDGFACNWDPTPFRQAAQTVRARE